MISTLICHTAESPIGRFDPNLLSDQEKMEIVFAGIAFDAKRAHGLCDETEEWRDFCKTTFIRCDAKGSIFQVDNAFFHGSGSLSLDFLPSKIKQFDLSNLNERERLCGTLGTEKLPQGLRSFSLRHQSLSGTVNVQTLPKEIRIFDISDNGFEGTCDLTALPKKIIELIVEENKFRGTVSLQSLPPAMEILNLRSCEFHGPVSFENLPEDMEKIDISDNSFSGVFKLVGGLPNLTVVAKDNGFDATAIVCRWYATKTYLQQSKVEVIVDENGTEYDEMHMYYMLGWQD